MASMMRYLLIFPLLFLVQMRTGMVEATDIVVQRLANVTNDRNSELQSLDVVLNAGRVVGLRFDTLSGADRHVSEFSIDDMKAGAVLDGDATHKALVLRGSIDAAGKADVIVTYLSNGLLGRYRDCRARIVRDDKGHWHILNVYDRKWVDHLFVQTWALGISTIGGICPR